MGLFICLPEGTQQAKKAAGCLISSPDSFSFDLSVGFSTQLQEVDDSWVFSLESQNNELKEARHFLELREENCADIKQIYSRMVLICCTEQHVNFVLAADVLLSYPIMNAVEKLWLLSQVIWWPSANHYPFQTGRLGILFACTKKLEETIRHFWLPLYLHSLITSLVVSNCKNIIYNVVLISYAVFFLMILDIWW